MLAILLLWTCYIIGIISILLTGSTNAIPPSSSLPDKKSKPEGSEIVEAAAQIDPELFAKAITHAKTMIMSHDLPSGGNQQPSSTIDESLVEQLKSGNIEALFTVAQSLNRRNAGDDRVTSVQIWHALADGPAQHIPSAVALGFSYSEVDKPLALQYFLRAAQGRLDVDENGSENGEGPHQAALYNAGRLFLELSDAASSLAYIRACATLDQSYPHYAQPILTQTCKEAYETLSAQLQGENVVPPGIEDAAEMFLYSNINEFPLPESKEFALWSRAMEYLEKYTELAQAGGETAATRKSKGKTYLVLAQEELEKLKENAIDKMSNLQNYLLQIILGRVQFLMTALEIDGDEL